MKIARTRLCDGLYSTLRQLRNIMKAQQTICWYPSFAVRLMYPLFVLGCSSLLAVLAQTAVAQGQSEDAVDSAHPAIAAEVQWPPGVQDLGRRSPGAAIDVLVTLRFNHIDRLQQLIRDQSDYSSPSYHQYLTPEQFSEQFSPSPDQLNRVVEELKKGGFQVTGTSSNRLLVHATAPTVTVENYVGTEIHSVSEPGYGERYLNVKPATLPDSLVPLVKAVNIQNAVIAMKGAITGPIQQGGPGGGYTPVAVANSFNFPVQHGHDGTGHTGAVIIDSDIADSDLAAFFAFFPITRTGTITREPVDGAVPGTINGDVNETGLDVETIGGLAPGANVIIYLIPSLGNGQIDDAVNQIVIDNTAEVVNMSFGYSFEFVDPTFESEVLQGNTQGITFVGASGDHGSAGGVTTPSSEPHVLALGGTVISYNQAAGKYLHNTAWDSSTGGVSTVFAIPSYQEGVSGLASTTFRNVPDLAFPADFSANYISGGWVGEFGTSWSCPIYVALQLEINQVQKQRFGWVNTNVYSVFQASGDHCFYDVTKGNNGGYKAKAGYNNVTGIGSPKGKTLAGEL